MNKKFLCTLVLLTLIVSSVSIITVKAGYDADMGYIGNGTSVDRKLTTNGTVGGTAGTYWKYGNKDYDLTVGIQSWDKNGTYTYLGYVVGDLSQAEIVRKHTSAVGYHSHHSSRYSKAETIYSSAKI